MQYNTVERSWILRALLISKSAGKFQHLSIQYDQITLYQKQGAATALPRFCKSHSWYDVSIPEVKSPPFQYSP